MKHAESGYSSSREEEDTVTGELGGALRTDEAQIVNVTDEQVSGVWRWSITYSKFGSKSLDATESIVGADGILEIRVGSPERDQWKSALFQAKNNKRRDARLVEQCAKMSVWREASFVINYSTTGYRAYSIDDIILAGGSIARANNAIPLATWIIETFIGCKVGHPDLYYDKDERKLYWVREQSMEGGYEPDRWVWVDFSPRYLIHIDVTPPDWERSNAKEIAPDKISLNRLTFTPGDLFGIEAPFSLRQLKRRRDELLRVYHSDKSYHLSGELRRLLDARVIEIYEAFSKLAESIVAEKTPAKQAANKEKSTDSLRDPRIDTIDMTKNKMAEPVRVSPKKSNTNKKRSSPDS